MYGIPNQPYYNHNNNNHTYYNQQPQQQHHHQNAASMNINNNLSNNNTSKCERFFQQITSSSCCIYFHLSEDAQTAISTFFQLPKSCLERNLKSMVKYEKLVFQGEVLMKQLIIESVMKLSKLNSINNNNNININPSSAMLTAMKNFADDTTMENAHRLVYLLVEKGTRIVGLFLQALFMCLPENSSSSSSSLFSLSDEFLSNMMRNNDPNDLFFAEVNKPLKKFQDSLKTLMMKWKEQNGVLDPSSRNDDNNTSNNTTSSSPTTSGLSQTELEVLQLSSEITSTSSSLFANNNTNDRLSSAFLRNPNNNNNNNNKYQKYTPIYPSLFQSDILVVSSLPERRRFSEHIGKLFFACLYLCSTHYDVDSVAEKSRRQQQDRRLFITRQCFASLKKWQRDSSGESDSKENNNMNNSNNQNFDTPEYHQQAIGRILERMIQDKSVLELPEHVMSSSSTSTQSPASSSSVCEFSHLNTVNDIYQRRNESTNFIEIENDILMKRQGLDNWIAAQQQQQKETKHRQQQKNRNSNNKEQHKMKIADEKQQGEEKNSNNKEDDDDDDFGNALNAVAQEFTQNTSSIARRREREPEDDDDANTNNIIPENSADSKNNDGVLDDDEDDEDEEDEDELIVNIHRHPRFSSKIYFQPDNNNGGGGGSVECTKEFFTCCGNVITSSKPCSSQKVLLEKLEMKKREKKKKNKMNTTKMDSEEASFYFIKVHIGDVIEGPSDKNPTCYAHWSCCGKALVMPPPSASSTASSVASKAKYQIIPEFVSGCKREEV